MSPASLLLLLWVCFACIADIRSGVQAQASCEPERCGNLTVSSPDGIISGSEENRCAQPGFQIHCNDGVPYLGYYEPWFVLQILGIFYNNGSLLVSDVRKLANFHLRGGCRVPKANTAAKIGPPFSISLLNQNLIFYNCTKPLAPDTAARLGLVETVCHNNTFVRVEGQYTSSGRIDGGYALPGCNATAVPVLGASGIVNASNYEELIGDGFLLTWQLPPAAGGSGKLTRPLSSSSNIFMGSN